MELGNHERLKGFAFCSAKHFVDVKRVYSMAINRDSGMNAPLLAAAGHQGMVSILRLFKKDKEQGACLMDVCWAFVMDRLLLASLLKTCHSCGSKFVFSNTPPPLFLCEDQME